LESEEARFFIVESNSSILTPKRYRNEFGQLLEHSPFCERDIRTPERLEPKDEKGEFEIRVRAQGMITSYTYDFHPLDAVGWDGYLYPYAFSIHDFELLQGEFTSPLQSIRHLKRIIMLFVHSYHVYMTTILMRSLLLMYTAMWTVMKYSIMWMGTL
jgi:homogentisate 1,2-dioxygenase